jgi:hypothetical protein
MIVTFRTRPVARTHNERGCFTLACALAIANDPPAEPRSPTTWPGVAALALALNASAAAAAPTPVIWRRRALAGFLIVFPCGLRHRDAATWCRSNPHRCPREDEPERADDGEQRRLDDHRAGIRHVVTRGG